MENETIIYRLYYNWEGSSSGGQHEKGFFASLVDAMKIGKEMQTFGGPYEWRKKWTDRAWVAAGILSMVVYVGFMVYASR